MATITAHASVAPLSKSARRVSIVLAAIPALFLVFDGVIHLLVIAPVVDSAAQLGVPLEMMRPLGVVELACLALYLAPRTSVLGAILLTGYLGGAVATQARIHAPLFSTLLFPIYLGVMLWGALYLRDARVRGLLVNVSRG